MSLMNEVLKEQLDRFVIVYLDDIPIYSSTWKEHLEHVRTVLEILRANKLFAKASKCTFGPQNFDYLGFILRPNRIAISPHKTEAIEKWPTPRNKKDVQSFLGLINYYRRCIKNCSQIAKPLTELTKDVPYLWDQATQSSFNKLKTLVSSAPLLQTFNPILSVSVTTDASTVAIGAVLEQEKDGLKRPAAFTSRTLNPSERNYAPHELDLLAIVDTLRAWRAYLHGRKFTVHTDHLPLRYLQTQDHLPARQVRWLERLTEFDFEIIPVKCKPNTVADALSRNAQDAPSQQDYNRERLNKVLHKTFVQSSSISSITMKPHILEVLAHEYREDSEFRSTYQNPKGAFYQSKLSALFKRPTMCPYRRIQKRLVTRLPHGANYWASCIKKDLFDITTRILLERTQTHSGKLHRFLSSMLRNQSTKP